MLECVIMTYYLFIFIISDTITYSYWINLILILTVDKFKYMTMNSRGFPKSNRASNVYEGGAFLGRPSDNAYEYNSSSRNYNTSRDGIFASELTKREMKKKES